MNKAIKTVKWTAIVAVTGLSLWLIGSTVWAASMYWFVDRPALAQEAVHTQSH